MPIHHSRYDAARRSGLALVGVLVALVIAFAVAVAPVVSDAFAGFEDLDFVPPVTVAGDTVENESP